MTRAEKTILGLFLLGLVIYALTGCSSPTWPNSFPSNWVSPPYQDAPPQIPAVNTNAEVNANLLPPVPQAPALAFQIRRSTIAPGPPANGQVICRTNLILPNGRMIPGITCITNTNSLPAGGLMIQFPCDTNAADHSVAQTSPDGVHWQDLPASWFGCSNFNLALGTYLFGSSNQSAGLLATNWRTEPMRFYREAWRP